MRKLILLMLVILIALPAYAGLDFKDLKLNGHYRLRGYYIENADNNQSIGDINRFFRQRIWLGTEGNVAENIFFSATAEHEKEWGKDNMDALPGSKGDFSLVYGYVKLSKLFDKDLTLTVGRQPYQLNKNNFVIWDNANGLDGMTLCYKNGNWDLDALYLKVNEVVGGKDVDDQEFYGVVANYKGFEGHKIQGYILLDRDASGVAGGDESDLKQYVGIRAEGNVKSVPGLSYIGEYINLSGDDGQINETDYKSSLLYAYAGYEFKDMKNFKILADYLWASGDGEVDDEEEDFQASSVAGNQMLEGNINFDFGMDAAKRAGVTYSNIKALGIGASVKPTDKLTLGAKYSMLEEDEGDDIGNNFDFYASYKMSDKYSLCAGYSMFDCDDEYKTPDDKTDVLAAELRINF